MDRGSEALNTTRFGARPSDDPAPRRRTANRLAAHDWRGSRAIQLIVEHREPVE